jgi:hypothetical protein
MGRLVCVVDTDVTCIASCIFEHLVAVFIFGTVAVKC